MDIVAHGLWAGIAVAAVARRRPVSRREAGLAVGLALLPDLAHALPVLALALVQPGGLALLAAYATALPGLEPPLPPPVAGLAHHLHCTLHSAVVAAAVSALLWRRAPALRLPLLGWWSHIVIDVFTHSARFYPSPVLYPFTQAGFDGVAWNTPGFMLLNYAAMLAAALALWLTRRRRTRT